MIALNLALRRTLDVSVHHWLMLAITTNPSLVIPRVEIETEILS